ncbi:DUF2946 domain-containing protein [Hydrogenophaga palleronii]|uniref:DUF2946 domain-containing protein n=1 Tax=Hydrogenophaga palleronii TaxID=65655 RepID=UPI000825AE48|nr:DUF2946 domain-containing protein [Hydrogenophaga palleronii]
MRFPRATHRIAAWLAMLAMVLGALAPTLAQAVVAAQGGPGWMQVCSASGMVWVQTDAQGDLADMDVGKSMADASRHCPWCQLHGAAGLPPAPLAVTDLAAPTAAPLWRASVDEPATFWPAAPSRAPPRV